MDNQQSTRRTLKYHPVSEPARQLPAPRQWSRHEIVDELANFGALFESASMLICWPETKHLGLELNDIIAAKITALSDALLSGVVYEN